MLRARGRCLVIAVSLAAILSYIPASGGPASAAVVAIEGGQATCKQLPKSQIQSVLSVPIGKVKVTSALQTGQQCVYSGTGSGDGDDIDVLVFNGSQAKPEFQEEVKGWGPKVAVGSDDTVPGVSGLEVNGTSDIPESANAIIASALGTICNRLYGKGNTKPSLQGLSALVPATTGS